MNSKRVNWLFLCLVSIDVVELLLMAVFYLLFQKGFDIPIAAGLILSQAMIMIPTLLFMLDAKRKPVTGSFNEMLGFHKIKISSFFMTILFTFLCMPLASALNAISMLFVENTVNAISDEVLQMPFILMLFLIGIFGPFCEEFVFRGVIFRGYKNSGPVFWSVFWSGLLFGLMHLNFNQAPYAFALGIMFALLVEATGSLWSSAIAHMVVNSQQVCLMYLLKYLLKYLPDSDTFGTMTQGDLIGMIGPYLIMAAIATPLAVCVLFWLAKNEGREDKWKNIWACRKEKREKFISIPLIIAIVLGFAYMMGWIMYLAEWIIGLKLGNPN